MAEEIKRYEPQHPELWDSEKNLPMLAWNDRPVQTTEEQAMMILAPMFAMWPNVKSSGVMIAQYVRLLCDMSPERLQAAVDAAIQDSEFLPTVAAIRKKYEEQRVKNDMEQTEPYFDRYGRKWIRQDYPLTREERMAQLRRYKNRDRQSNP